MKRLLFALVPVFMACNASKRCGNDAALYVTHVHKEGGRIEVFARNRWQLWRAQFTGQPGADTLKKGDKLIVYSCTKKLHETCCHVEFIRIR